MPLAQYGTTMLLNLALAIAVGTCTTILWTTQATSAWARSRVRTVRGLGLVALAVAVCASAGLLWLEAAAMAEVPLAQAAGAVRLMLTSTHLGLAWKIGMGALLLGIAAMSFASSGRHAGVLMFVALTALAGFLYTRSMVSHASASGDFSLTMVVDWIHLTLICLWVGEVVVSGFVVLATSAGASPGDRNDCARYVELLSTSATLALVGIFVTGLFNAWFNLGGTSALVRHPYGTTLLIKLTLVMGAVLLGAANRFIVMPGLIASLRSGHLAAGKATRQFTLLLRIEAAVLVTVLIMAAILSSSSPPTAG
ncbi:MAG: copper resistance protein CopD [Massilia sp.]|nr:copper resistance protein CopD [Massilia sp.]